MAGLYVHIPFCKKRCFYCDFFSTTLLQRQEEYIEALVQEIAARKNETGEAIQTIYLGGGTPSTMTIDGLRRILQAIGTEGVKEITMELNPGDATTEYLQSLRSLGVNRLSIGIQSFQDELLQRIGRRHDAKQAIATIQMAQQAGFDNLSIDLMYALPGQTPDMWQADIQTAIGMDVQHISCYGLMYEEGTTLTRMKESGEIEPIDEETELGMYDLLCEQLQQAGFVHYEVSNFALPGYEGKHNSSYWDGTPYVGVGAGAHSFIGNVRSWNPDNLDAYIRGILAHNLQRESETLTERDLYNEHIMLGLRTNRGIEKSFIGPLSDPYRTLPGPLSEFVAEGLLRETTDGRLVATQKGLPVLNLVIEKLMIDE